MSRTRMPLMMPNSPWDRLSIGDARRVNGTGQYDFFWIVLEDSVPALALKLGKADLPSHQIPKLRSLDLRYRLLNGVQALVLSLTDRSLSDTFVALCLDVVRAGEASIDADQALSHALHRTRRWHYLLRGGASQELSPEEQRGLVAELTFLRAVVKTKGAEFAVEGWKGPEGASKDFEFPRACVEVKARRAAAKPYVAISSEDQLADVPGARLFLNVTDVASAVGGEGLTLHDHVEMVSSLLKPSPSALARFEDLLMSMGYDAMHRYEDRRWTVGGDRVYEVSEGFPRLCTPLPSGVANLRYSIALSACMPFEVGASVLDQIN